MEHAMTSHTTRPQGLLLLTTSLRLAAPGGVGPPLRTMAQCCWNPNCEQHCVLSVARSLRTGSPHPARAGPPCDRRAHANVSVGRSSLRRLSSLRSSPIFSTSSGMQFHPPHNSMNPPLDAALASNPLMAASTRLGNHRGVPTAHRSAYGWGFV